jgi:hypothetical protein
MQEPSSANVVNLLEVPRQYVWTQDGGRGGRDVTAVKIHFDIISLFTNQTKAFPFWTSRCY